MRVVAATSQPAISSVTLTLSHEEAKKLRRVCYYNKSVSRKYRDNPAGGRRKAEDIDAFMGSLGNSLKAQGVERF
jgi:hypothetical protein